ncbi:MAG: hypothetical protein NUW37_05980 [Planctomycetes bacterium]|nr:hypothetical protein [Planctomycetota bacterium]
MFSATQKRKEFPDRLNSGVDLRSQVLRPSALSLELESLFSALSAPPPRKKSQTDSLVLYLPMECSDFVRGVEEEFAPRKAQPAKSKIESFRELVRSIPERYSKLDICREISRMPQSIAHAYGKRLRAPMLARDALQVVGGFKRSSRKVYGSGGKYEKSMLILSEEDRLLTKDISLGFVIQNLSERPAHFVGIAFRTRVTRVSSGYKKIGAAGATRTQETQLELFEDIYIVESLAPETNIEDFIVKSVREDILKKYIKKEMRSFQVVVEIEIL